MKVSEVMTQDVRLIEPAQSIQEAARLMAELDAGIMPVREGDRLVGMITDRDITVRAVAQGRGPDTAVREVMTDDVKYCYEDGDTHDAARNMADIQVRDPPVWECWPPGCEIPATASPAFPASSVTAMSPSEMMPTRRLSRVSTGRRRTWMSAILRATSSVSSSS